MSDYDVIRLKECPRVGWHKDDAPLKRPHLNCANRCYSRGSPIALCAYTPSIANYCERKHIVYNWRTRFVCVLQTSAARELIAKIERMRKK